MALEVDGLTGALDFLTVEGTIIVVGSSLVEDAIVAVVALLDEGADVGASGAEGVAEDADPAVDVVSFAVAALFSAMMAWILAASIALVDLRLLLLSMISICVRFLVWV